MKKIKKVLSTLGVFGAIFGVCCTIQSAGAMQHDKVFFVGDSSSGRCKVFKKLADSYSGVNYFDSASYSGAKCLDDDFRQIKVVDDYDGDEVSLDLYVTSGQEKHRNFAVKMISKEANTVVLVYAVDEKVQPQEEYLRWWLDHIKKANSEISIILLGRNDDRLIDLNEVDNRLEAMANNLGIEEKDRVIVSTKNGYQIGELGQMLARKALDRANRVQENSEVKNLTDSQNKKSGCLLL